VSTVRPALAARNAVMRSSTLRDLVSVTSGQVTAPAVAVLSLAGGLPPVEAFPAAALGMSADRVLSSTAGPALQYCPTEGDGQLLELIAADLMGRLGIPSPAGRTLVTAGSQQALDLVGKVLLDPGDVAVVEYPAYVGALRAFAAYQPHIVGVPVDDAGIDTDRLAGVLAGGLRPKLCYVVPNFSNPSGATMPASRRLRLAELARRYGFVVVEDDPYGQLRFAGDDVEPIAAGGDAAEAVVYLGSFSKVVAPGLRVGYTVVPDWLMRPLVVAKQASDLSSSALAQRLVAELLADPDWFARHVAGLVDLYRRRAEALLGALGRVLPERLAIRAPTGGMFAWASILVPGVDAMALSRAAMARGVAIVPGDEFAVDGGFPTQVRLSFSMLDPARLVRAVDRLGLAFDDLAALADAAAGAAAQ
jgi:2-aminoadipate transaminase